MKKMMEIFNLHDRNNNRDRGNREKNNNRTTKNKNKNKKNIEERTDKFIIGTKVIIKINKVPYEGKIIGYKNSYYKIRYNDDKETELSHQKVSSNLKDQILTSRQRRRKRQVDLVERQVKNLVQSNLQGEQIPAKDSELFGHSYPTRINNNCSIITYQNTGQQPKYGFYWKAKETSRAFKNSRASVAMYTETGLNEKKVRNVRQI